MFEGRVQIDTTIARHSCSSQPILRAALTSLRQSFLTGLWLPQQGWQHTPVAT